MVKAASLFVNSPIINSLFEEHFSNQFDKRWSQLREALQKKEKQILRINRFSSAAIELKENLQGDYILCDFLPYSYWRPDGKNSEEKNLFYIMDPASVIVAKALEAKPHELVLDLCAAPGGKSLVMAEDMFFAGNVVTGQLISNEYSESRRDRLLKVFQNYIPKDNRQFINVKGLDGNQYGLRQPETYDKILADVPCSGERHLFENPSELKLWTARRTKNLAIRQYSLLSSSWLACKENGRIVYSTCSISQLENDEVVRKLTKKRAVEILRPDFLKNFSFLEQTEFGYQILPDVVGFGPMYFAVIKKI